MADENVAENDPIGYGSHFLLQQPDLTHVAWLDPKIHHTFKGMKLTSSPKDAPTDETLEATLSAPTCHLCHQNKQHLND